MLPRYSFAVLMFAALLVLQSTAARAQPPSRTAIPGQIIEKVICQDKPEQSYALYLPSSYSPDKSWPIVLTLDPGARGKVPVERFKEAAETYGWIIAASNNSRNGPIEPSIEAINAIWNDARARFSINYRRVYFAGFSGAARAAITIANACNCAAGLITGGAGFPHRFAPSAITLPAIYTTVGTDDFNFPEVKEAGNALAKTGIEHQVRVFAGTHEWAPSLILLEAVEWMELHGMKSGRHSQDTKLIDKLWKKSLDRASALEQSNNMFEALLTYQSISTTFRSLRDVTDAHVKISQLKNLPAVKQAIRDEGDQIRKQLSLQQEIWNLIEQSTQPARPADVGAGTSANSRALERDASLAADARLLGILADLKKQSSANEDSGKRRVARRVWEGVNTGLVERGLLFLEGRKLYSDALSAFQLLAKMNPEQPGAFYYLAWGHAAAGNQKKALENLQRAVEKGFTNLRALNENKAFDALRKDPAYAAVVKTIETKR